MCDLAKISGLYWYQPNRVAYYNGTPMRYGKRYLWGPDKIPAVLLCEDPREIDHVRIEWMLDGKRHVCSTHKSSIVRA